jgi:hypothetical protein
MGKSGWSSGAVDWASCDGRGGPHCRELEPGRGLAATAERSPRRDVRMFASGASVISGTLAAYGCRCATDRTGRTTSTSRRGSR